MDVLVLGPEGADVDAVTRTLTTAGHPVHRCAPTTGSEHGGDCCVGASDHGQCPLNGPVDVALVVGDGHRSDGIAPIGLGCAVRDRLPLATLPLGGNAIATCEGALSARDAEWTDRLRAALGRDDVHVTSERQLENLRVTVHADIESHDVAAADRIAMRTYDIVRDDLPAGYRSVDVAMAGVNLGA